MAKNKKQNNKRSSINSKVPSFLQPSNKHQKITSDKKASIENNEEMSKSSDSDESEDLKQNDQIIQNAD